MPSTARASHKHQNECTRDEMLFIPAFTRHNLRSKAGDADADEVEFEGCSQSQSGCLMTPSRKLPVLL